MAPHRLTREKQGTVVEAYEAKIQGPLQDKDKMLIWRKKETSGKEKILWI